MRAASRKTVSGLPGGSGSGRPSWNALAPRTCSGTAPLPAALTAPAHTGKQPVHNNVIRKYTRRTTGMKGTSE